MIKTSTPRPAPRECIELQTKIRNEWPDKFVDGEPGWEKFLATNGRDASEVHGILLAYVKWYRGPFGWLNNLKPNVSLTTRQQIGVANTLRKDADLAVAIPEDSPNVVRDPSGTPPVFTPTATKVKSVREAVQQEIKQQKEEAEMTTAAAAKARPRSKAAASKAEAESPTPRRRKKAAPATADEGGVAPEADYLANLVPDLKVYRNYVSRYVGDVLDMDLLAMAHDEGENVLIAGDTGSGKTMLLRAYCAKERLPFVNMAGDGSSTADDFLGGPSIDVVTGGLRWLDGPSLMAVQNPNGALLNMDEVNFLKGRTTAPFHGLLDDRGVLTLNKHPFHWLSSKTGMYYITKEDAQAVGDVADVVVTGAAYIKKSPRLLVVATYNEDYADTNPLNEAFANRFNFKIPWGYDSAVEEHLIKSKTLRDVVNNYRKAKAAGRYRTPLSTNMAMTFERLACSDRLNSYTYAVMNFIASFQPEDRAAITEVMEGSKARLMAEYGWEFEES